MRNIDGLEMVCFCKSKHFTLEYSGGGYTDLRGKPIKDLMDMNCYVCTASFYTRESDPIAYCPNCGHFDRARFDTKQDLIEALRGNDLDWLKKTPTGAKALLVQTWDGDWRLRFGKSEAALNQSGQFQKVVAY